MARVCVAHPSAAEDERDSFKLNHVVRLRPNDLPDRSKESGSYSPLFFGKLTIFFYFLTNNGLKLTIHAFKRIGIRSV